MSLRFQADNDLKFSIVKRFANWRQVSTSHPPRTPVAQVAEAIVLVWAASIATEMSDQIYHLPSLVRHTFTR